MHITLGVYDPFARTWLEGFYPDDLPEDWRLDYLANAYRAFALPASRRTLVAAALPAGLEAFLVADAPLPAEMVSGWKALVTLPDAQSQPMQRVTLQGGVEWVLLRPGEPLNLREIRASVERLEAELSPQARVYLMIEAPPAALEQVRVMLELMGY